MFLATSNKAMRLLCLSYIGRVQPEELARNEENVKTLLTELPPKFRLLVNLSQLDSMGPDCAPAIGRMMEVFDQSNVGLIVRVIPEPSKDIGFNILAAFHYPHRPQIKTCASLTEAGEFLAL